MSTESSSGGFIARLRTKINKGDSWLTYDLDNLLPGQGLDDDALEELETRLLTADVGVEATMAIVDHLRAEANAGTPSTQRPAPPPNGRTKGPAYGF